LARGRPPGVTHSVGTGQIRVVELTMGNHGCASTDAEIARRIVAGDRDAFEEILNKYQRHVLNIIKKHVPYGHVEDVAQDVFIRVFQSLPLATIEEKNRFEGWVSIIAIRTCYDFWRKRYRSRELSISSLTERQQAWLEGVLSEASAQSFRQKGLEKEAREILDWALDKLSAGDRMVVELVHLEGYSAREAGRLLGWSTANVKVRSFRSRKKLRHLLEEAWKEGRRDEIF